MTGFTCAHIIMRNRKAGIVIKNTMCKFYLIKNKKCNIDVSKVGKGGRDW